jgi:3-methylfumaryl-CoA hydratase
LSGAEHASAAGHGAGFRDWLSRRESRGDVAAAWPAAALAATLDINDVRPAAGAPLPPGWHWLYFLDTALQSQLGEDGHPRRGGFLPPVTLPRRMWAGGRFEFRQPLQSGETIRRDSEIISIEPKRGRSGDMVFVTVRHTVSGANGVAVIEDHDIVYREAATADSAPPRREPAPVPAQWQREVVSDPVLLFRFSALTFNGHRIHYDPDYATRIEHYPGLVIHGPLQTILLLDLCRRHAPQRTLTHFDYRARAPLFHPQTFTVNGTPSADGTHADLWTADANGCYAMTATARFGTVRSEA